MSDAPQPAAPSRVKGFILGLIAVIAALGVGQWLIEFMAWPSNFLVSLAVFIVLDLIFMFVLNRIFSR